MYQKCFGIMECNGHAKQCRELMCKVIKSIVTSMSEYLYFGFLLDEMACWWFPSGCSNRCRNKHGFLLCLHYKCKDAILNCNQLAFTFPKTADRFEASERDFSNLSTGKIIHGCVACIDGILPQIQTPSSGLCTGSVLGLEQTQSVHNQKL